MSSLLNRREALVLGSAAATYGLVPVAGAKAFAIDEANDWAKIAAQQFMKMGVHLVKNERDVGEGLRLSEGLIQRHVDWLDEMRDGKPTKTDIRHITAALGLLTVNVARSIGPARQLKTYSLMLPKSGIYNGVRLAYGHVRLRFLQSYFVGNPDGLGRPEGVLNRIDVLFPWHGV